MSNATQLEDTEKVLDSLAEAQTKGIDSTTRVPTSSQGSSDTSVILPASITDKPTTEKLKDISRTSVRMPAAQEVTGSSLETLSSNDGSTLPKKSTSLPHVVYAPFSSEAMPIGNCFHCLQTSYCNQWRRFND